MVEGPARVTLAWVSAIAVWDHCLPVRVGLATPLSIQGDPGKGATRQVSSGRPKAWKPSRAHTIGWIRRQHLHGGASRLSPTIRPAGVPDKHDLSRLGVARRIGKASNRSRRPSSLALRERG